MSGYRATVGAAGEEIASAYLIEHGMRVIDRNFRCRYGEIDIVCRDGATLVFCEVKARRTTVYGLPEEAITARKLDHVRRAAETYLATHGCPDADWRIDLVAVEQDHAGATQRVTHYKAIGD